MNYTGLLNQDPTGTGFFVTSRYKEDSKEYLTWVTKLEPGYARKVFPCLDEPHFRATFDIKLGRRVDYTAAVSNMPKVLCMFCIVAPCSYSGHFWITDGRNYSPFWRWVLQDGLFWPHASNADLSSQGCSWEARIQRSQIIQGKLCKAHPWTIILLSNKHFKYFFQVWSPL